MLAVVMRVEWRNLRRERWFWAIVAAFAMAGFDTAMYFLSAILFLRNSLMLVTCAQVVIAHSQRVQTVPHA